MRNDKYGFIDKTGKVVIPLIYEFAGDFHEGLACVKNKGDGKCGFLDKTGKLAVPCAYYTVSDFQEGLAIVSKDYKYGVIDKAGKEVVPCVYYYINNFREGLALAIEEIEEDGKIGYIDETGNLVIEIDKIQSVSQEKINDNNKVYDVVETMPSFPGGQTALMSWLSANFYYPEEAVDNRIKGRVIVSFYVEQDGSITEVEIEKSVHPLLDNASIQLVKKMPKWIPGTRNGSPVRVKYNVPLSYNFTEQ